MQKLLLKLGIISLLVFSLGCSTLQGFFFPTALDKSTEVIWEKDLKFQVHDKIYYGTAVVPKRDVYTIYIFPPTDEISRLQWRTCHREGSAKDAVKDARFPWSKSQKYFKMEFIPRPIELERACPLKFEALAKKRKEMAFGMVAFPDSRPWFDVPATVECNGEVNQYLNGTSMCQAPVGAISRIDFGPDAYVFEDERPSDICPPFKNKGNGVFEFKMPKDECVYNFKKAEDHSSGNLRSHKFITFGFEQSPPNED